MEHDQPGAEQPDAALPDPAARIDTALARIEAAIGERGRAADALARRHSVLRSRMAEAVKALDDVISRGADT